MKKSAEFPKAIGYWSGVTHGRQQFATLEDAEIVSALYVNSGVDCGWYWQAGEISKDADGTFWVVIP